MSLVDQLRVPLPAAGKEDQPLGVCCQQGGIEARHPVVWMVVRVRLADAAHREIDPLIGISLGDAFL